MRAADSWGMALECDSNRVLRVAARRNAVSLTPTWEPRDPTTLKQVLSVTSLLGRCTYAIVLLAIAAEYLPRVLDTAAVVAVGAAMLVVVMALRPSVAAELRAERDAV